MLLADLTTPEAAAPSALGVAVRCVLLALLLALSATFSGSEAALFSLSRVQFQSFAASSSRLRRMAARLMDEPKRTLAVILLGNTTVNVLIFANNFVLFRELRPVLGPWSDVLGAVVGVLLIAVFGEAIPKTLCVNMPERAAPLVAPVIRAFGAVLGPIQRAIDFFVVEPVNRLLFGLSHRDAGDRHSLSTIELKTLLEMSRRHGMIDPSEDAFLRSVIDLGTLRVRDVMVPRVDVMTYDVGGSPDGLRELMRRTRRKKVPVFDGSVDNIVGLIYAKVLFFQPNRPLRQLVVPVRFVPELATGEQLLQHFRQTRTQLAVVVDEYGGMAGLVTLEDVLETIVGDLESGEEQSERPEIETIGPDEYELSGQLSVHYWSQWFGLPRAAERISTVGGLVMAELGRPARVGDRVQLGNVEMLVTEVRRRRVERLRLRLTALEAVEATVGGRA